MRVVSLLPSATEIICTVGARDHLVARSHECDFPKDITSLPILTHPRQALPNSSQAIDRAVHKTIADALAVYEINLDALAKTQPSIIVTQDLCDVCAVALNDVQAGLQTLGMSGVEICSLSPMRLADVWADIRRVGQTLGHAAQGEAAAAELENRCTAIAKRAQKHPRPKVLSIEWLDPVMIGGTWMPELIDLAGGTPLVTQPGEHAPTLKLEELSNLDPDIVLIKPCGFDLPRTEKELSLLRSQLPWDQWTAVAKGRVFLSDGNAYFNRPGPRLVESLEILAAITHPSEFHDFVTRHRESVRRVTAKLEVEPIDTE